MSLSYTSIENKDYEKVYAKIKDPKFTQSKIAQVLHSKMMIPYEQAVLVLFFLQFGVKKC